MNEGGSAHRRAKRKIATNERVARAQEKFLRKAAQITNHTPIKAESLSLGINAVERLVRAYCANARTEEIAPSREVRIERIAPVRGPTAIGADGFPLSADAKVAA